MKVEYSFKKKKSRLGCLKLQLVEVCSRAIEPATAKA